MHLFSIVHQFDRSKIDREILLYNLREGSCNRWITKISELWRRTLFPRPSQLIKGQSRLARSSLLTQTAYSNQFLRRQMTCWLFSRFFEVNENELLEIWLSSTLTIHLASSTSIIWWFEFLKSLLSELWLCIVFVCRFIFQFENFHSDKF